MRYSAFQLIKRIFMYARAYWIHIIGLFLLTLLATPIALLKPYGLKMVIDSGFSNKPLPGFIRTVFPSNFDYSFAAIIAIATGFILLVALIENLNSFVSWLYSTYTGEKLVLNFRTILFNHIQRLSLAYHDTKGPTDSLYRIQWDTMSIRSFLLGQISPLVSSSVTLISMVAVMFVINWRFAVVALCIIPLLFLLIRLRATRLRNDWHKVKDAESSAISVVHEVLGSLRVVKAFGQEENESSRFVGKSNDAVKGQLRMAWMGASFQFMTGMIFTTGTAIVIYLGAHFVKGGHITLGDLTLVLAYLAQIFSPLQVISNNINEIQSSLVGIDRVFSVLDEEKEVVDTQHPMQLSRTKGAFEFRNVSFAYNNERRIIKGVSFDTRPGDRVGIMGSTGAGKSTLISLLNRFYDPTDGSIHIDGTDIRKFRLKDYRSQFSIVLQEPVLFSTTIGENIRYGKPDATDKEIIEAAKAANAHAFISRSKEGYDTLVGERGMQLSGGERQRISLARAFIKNAPVLILDEPTSSLDIKTEAQIMEAMERLMEGRTTFMITHRLETLNSCNVLVHLEGGELVEVVRDHDINYIAEKRAAFLKLV